MSSRAILTALLVAATSSARAQSRTAADAASRPLFVNDEWERYARIRQVAGDAPLYPWSVRDFGLREAHKLAVARNAHPWAQRQALPERKVGRLSLTLLPFTEQTIVNSSFPFGYNDGPVWAGRGLTTSLEGGVATTYGNFSAVFAPMVFRAENMRYTLRPNGLSGAYAFGDAFIALSIDQPQRFGDRAYARLDPGNSTIRFDASALALGFSTANQHWGPARDHPLLLGNNAAGFPHFFLGTNRPVDVFIGKVYGRMLWGRLDASPYTDMRQENRYRLASGIAAVLEPRGAPGLEIGMGRFFHLLWNDRVVTLANFARPFIGLVRDSRIKQSGNAFGFEPDNQLASFFGRWVFPKSGFEIYGEFGKEDYNKDLRDLEMEPDHIAGYLLGLQRVIKQPTNSYLVLRGELLNTRIGPLALNRPQSPFYVHGIVRQGHTNEGQVLGSAAAFGGGAMVLAADRYTTRGRSSLSWSRMLRAEDRDATTSIPDPQGADAFQVITWDGARFRHRGAFTYEITAAYEMNRNLERDAFNLRAAAGFELAW